MKTLFTYPKHFWTVGVYDSERYAAKVECVPGHFGWDGRYEYAKLTGNLFRTKSECEAWIDRVGWLVTSGS